MKTHIRDHVPAAAREYGALECRISEKSIERFLQDDRVWPIEAWITWKDEEDGTRLGLMRFYSDPTDPAPRGNPLVRNWNDRLEPTRGPVHRTIRECPEEIISQCIFETRIERVLAAFWETDHRKPQSYLTGGKQQ